MANDKDFVLDTMRNYGLSRATVLQAEAPNLSNDELNERQQYAPDFQAAIALKNMLERKAGFVCVSSAGRVVRLIQPYDSTVFTQEPEELAAQWGFVWSTDPKFAKPFVSLATSPYNKGECCTDVVPSEDGAEGTEVTHVYRSLQDNNVWAPSTTPEMWEQVD